MAERPCDLGWPLLFPPVLSTLTSLISLLLHHPQPYWSPHTSLSTQALCTCLSFYLEYSSPHSHTAYFLTLSFCASIIISKVRPSLITLFWYFYIRFPVLLLTIEVIIFYYTITYITVWLTFLSVYTQQLIAYPCNQHLVENPVSKKNPLYMVSTEYQLN